VIVRRDRVARIPTAIAARNGQDCAALNRTVNALETPGEIHMFGMTNDTGDNALDLLRHDHQEVDSLFKHYEEIKDGAKESEKEMLVARICDALTVHAQIEESIFYPAARAALPEEEGQDLLDEAAVEHQTLKDIIGRLEAAPTSDPLYDAGVKVLSEYVKHHVREEESELFPKVRSSDLDLQAIGEQLAQRKSQLEGRASRNGSRGRRGSRRHEAEGSPRGRDASESRQDSEQTSRNTH
jgi:hemerythrin-like domain-containing protein